MPHNDEQQRINQLKALENHERTMAQVNQRMERERSYEEGNQIEATARHMHDSMDRAERSELNSQLEHFARYGRS